MSDEKKPLTLADLGDVITDAQLAALMQRAPSWPRRERDRAKQYRVRPNLPDAMHGFAQPRYTKRAVQKWLDESSVAVRVVRRGRVA